MKLIFEKGGPGRHLALLPDCDVPEVLPLKNGPERRPLISLRFRRQRSAAITPSWLCEPGESTEDFIP